MRLLDTIIYTVTAPLRLFARSRRFRLILGAGCVVAVSFTAALWVLDRFFPGDAGGGSGDDINALLAKFPIQAPLQPVSRASYVIAPVAVALNAIRQRMDAAAPRELVGKNDNPVSSLLSKADIGITVGRGAMAVSGTPNELTISTPLNGSLKVTGQIATQAGNLTGGITGLLDSAVGRTVGNLTNKVLDQRADVHGQVTVHSRPALTANWRLEPNLTAQVVLGDSAVSLAGIKINMANEAQARDRPHGQ